MEWVVEREDLRSATAQTAEIKRMYVVPDLRGQGIARRLLTALEAESTALGIARLVLETGARQPEALALYERAGFARIPAFGEYVDSPLSVCMAKQLASAQEKFPVPSPVCGRGLGRGQALREPRLAIRQPDLSRRSS
jgi:N-acetylglutamate synthase-like GNAT family acetyltransferase